MKVFNEKWFQTAEIEKLHKDFEHAQPYHFLKIDGLLDEAFANTLVENFPKKDDMRRHYKGLNEQKSEGSNFELYHESFRTLRSALGTSEFLSFLEKATGVEGLILPDDHRGSGVHQGTDGSFLDVHVDFSIHPVLNIHRRLNLLFFLNKEWKESYGGKLELWDKDVQNCGQAILPTFNRCVIFATSDISYHGYSTITVPEGLFRNSFFTYFYTPITTGEHVKYHDTIFKTRPSEGGLKKTQTLLKENTKNFIKGSLRKLGVRKFFDKME
ncbi:MAG: 2OG-Fe(II) oxygenase [Chitinophagales bacterium]|nr:2OG-Fe(II) oxygenase [Chitinophagales bacterium]